jgi:DNA-binding transcriptional ArsR family regulator
MTLRTRATNVFRALSDDSRRQILVLLRDGPKNVGEIAAHFEMSQPAVTHHLVVLRHAGLVSDERRGKNVYYSLEKQCLVESLSELMAATGLITAKSSRTKRRLKEGKT